MSTFLRNTISKLYNAVSEQTTHQDVNQKSAKGNGVCKDNYDPMGKMDGKSL